VAHLASNIALTLGLPPYPKPDLVFRLYLPHPLTIYLVIFIRLSATDAIAE